MKKKTDYAAYLKNSISLLSVNIHNEFVGVFCTKVNQKHKNVTKNKNP